MRAFRDIPIRQKLMVITMATTTAALLLAAIGIVTFDAALFRRSLIFDLSALSRIIADNSTAAIAFDDPQTASETLAALRARPHLVTACIYRADGSILARYARQEATSVCPPGAEEGAQSVSNPEPVACDLPGRRVNAGASLRTRRKAGLVKIYGATVLGVLVVSSVIAFLLTSRLRAVIEIPISHLVRATTSVSETNDYRIRAQKLSGDELGVLVDRFNEMLGGIQSRDNELRKALSEREEAARCGKGSRTIPIVAESMPQNLHGRPPERWTTITANGWSLPVYRLSGSRFGLDAIHSSGGCGRQCTGVAAFG
jgi:methyl-accepting chemotaxis protein